ncbi:hypothetical protein JCM14635_30410 [Megalodesulfovibrio paquesii]
MIRDVLYSGGRRLPSETIPLIDQAMGFLHAADAAGTPEAAVQRQELAFLLAGLARISRETAFVKLCWERLPRLGLWGDVLCVYSIQETLLSRQNVLVLLRQLPALAQLRVANRLLLLPVIPDRDPQDKSQDRELTDWALETVRRIQVEEPDEVLVFLERTDALRGPLAYPVQRELMRSRFGIWMSELLKLPISRQQSAYLATTARMLGVRSVAEALARHMLKAEVGTLLEFCRIALVCCERAEPGSAAVALVEAMQLHPLREVRLASLRCLAHWESPKAVEAGAALLHAASAAERRRALAILLQGTPAQWQAVLEGVPKVEQGELLLDALWLLAKTDPDRIDALLHWLRRGAGQAFGMAEEEMTDMGLVLDGLESWRAAAVSGLELPWPEAPACARVLPSPPGTGKGKSKSNTPALGPRTAARDAAYDTLRQDGADISRGEFERCVFHGGHLPRLHAEQARFVQCSFRNTVLPEAVFQETQFLDCRFEGCLVDAATFERATFLRCQFTACTLTGTRWKAVRLEDCRMELCDCSGISWNEVEWNAATLLGCSFLAARWTRLRTKAVHWQHCSMESLAARDWECRGGSMLGCSLVDARLEAVQGDESTLLMELARQIEERLDQAGTRDDGRATPTPPAALLAEEGGRMLSACITGWLELRAAARGEAAMLANNRRRRSWAACLLPSRARGLLTALPALLEAGTLPQSAHPPVADAPPVRHAPCRIHGYVPDQEALAMLREWHLEHHSLRSSPGLVGQQAIHLEALFTIGSSGTIAQSNTSDVDLWCCYDEAAVTPAQLEALERKCRHIELWAEEVLGMEVHFFLMSMDAVRENRFGFSSAESSGSAQARLLKEEFYRTGMLLAGKLPLWWRIPAGADAAAYARLRFWSEAGPGSLTGQSLRPMLASPAMDMGMLADIPREEYFGAALWQMVKALKSPFKSVMKVALLDRYVRENAVSPLLCDRIKARIHRGGKDMWEIDAYAVLFREVYEQYQRMGNTDAQGLMRLAFLRKTGLQDAASTGQALRRGEYQGFFFPYSETGIAMQLEGRPELADPGEKGGKGAKEDSFNESLKLGERIMRFLVATYANIHSAIGSGAVEAHVSMEDLLKLHRRISAFFTPRPLKILRIPFLDRGREPFRVMEFLSRGQPGQMLVWDVFAEPAMGTAAAGIAGGAGAGGPARGGRNARQLLNRDLSPERLCAWLHANALCGEQTQIAAQALVAPVSITDLQLLLAALRAFFPLDRVFAPPMEQLLKAEVVTACMVVGNFMVPREERALRQAAIIYATSWGELFCRPMARQLDQFEHAPLASLRANCHAPLSPEMTFSFHTPRRAQCRDVFLAVR